jgi:hypothetical protein
MLRTEGNPLRTLRLDMAPCRGGVGTGCPVKRERDGGQVDTIRGQLESLTAELSEWEAESRDTAFDVDR